MTMESCYEIFEEFEFLSRGVIEQEIKHLEYSNNRIVAEQSNILW